MVFKSNPFYPPRMELSRHGFLWISKRFILATGRKAWGWAY
jgi:hypothetical protein